MLRGFGAFLVVAMAAAAFDVARAADQADAKVVGAYYPAGSATRYPIERIPTDKITHLFYAFARIEDGRCVVGDKAAGHFEALAKLKREHPRLRTLISIGGWSAGGFSDAALTAKSRKRLVASCLALFFEKHRGSFDGADIDWEFPVYGGPPELAARPEDRRNMTALVREFRRALDALGRQRKQAYLVTAALPAGRMESAGPYDPARSFELGELARLLDFINLMTYDMGTVFTPVASFNAPMREVPEDPLDPQLRRWNSVEGGVDYYQRNGVPANKLVLGVPFYGRGYRVKSDARHGLYQAYSGTYPAGDYRDIKRKLLGDPQWQRHWHEVAQTPWLFNAKEQAFVSYEDPESIAIRAGFAKERGLLGVFTWELTADDERQALLEAMVNGMK